MIPAIVIEALDRAHRATAPVQRHHLAYYAIELCLKLGASARVALWRRSAGEGTPPAVPQLRRPSVGQWASLYRDLGRSLALAVPDHPLVVGQLERRRRPAVAAWLASARRNSAIASHQLRAGSLRLDDVFDALVTYRNRVLGHGAQRPEAFYAELGEVLVEVAEEVGADRALLGGLPLDGTRLGDLELRPLVILEDERFGVLEQLTRRGVQYLHYQSGEVFDGGDRDAVVAVVGAGRDAGTASAEIPRNLPRERDAFVGRSREQAAIVGALHDAPWVTVTGVSGVGKSRLVRAVGWQLLGAFPGGVWHADLADASTVDGVYLAIAAALQVGLRDQEPETQLVEACVERGRCLLIVDNADHHGSPVADVLGAILDQTESTVVLASARSAVGHGAERALPLAPLSTDEAVELLTRRVAARIPDYQLSPEARRGATALAHALGGLPIALELAAAKIGVRTPGELAAALAEDAAEMAPVREALARSWSLLASDQQDLLSQCAVFVGGFGVQSAEAVVRLSDPDATLPDALAGLVQASLLRRTTDDAGETRFRLRSSLEGFAAAMLEARADAPEVRRRHADHFARLGTVQARWAVRLRGGEAFAKRGVIEVENVVAAARRALDAADARRAPLLAMAAAAALGGLGRDELGRGLCRRAQELPGLEPDTRARLVLSVFRPWDMAREALVGIVEDPSLPSRSRSIAALFLGRSGPLEARRPWLQRAADLAADDPVLAADHALALAQTLQLEGRRPEAADRARAALRLARVHGDRFAEGRALAALMGISAESADYGRAIAYARESHDHAIATGNEVHALNMLAVIETLEFQREPHIRHAHRIEEILASRSREGARGLRMAHNNLAVLYLVLGHLDDAERHLEVALLGDARQDIVALIHANLAIIHLERGHIERALASAEASIGGAEPHTKGPFVLSTLAATRAWNGDHEGAQQAIRLAFQLAPDAETPVVLVRRAEVELLAGHAEGARAFLRQAQERADSGGQTPFFPRLRDQVARRVAAASRGALELCSVQGAGPVRTQRFDDAQDALLAATLLPSGGALGPHGPALLALCPGRRVGCVPDLAGLSIPDGWHAHVHGHWRISVDHVVELVELVRGADAPRSIPSSGVGHPVERAGRGWIPSDPPPGGVLTPANPFVGRVEELHGLDAHCRAGGVVTLLGPGGTGKTRLATTYASRMHGAFPGGVWFVDLADVRAIDGLFSAVASALDVQLGDKPRAQLARAAHAMGRVLLVLDNCEQISHAVADVLAVWASGAPDVTFLCTSRVRLEGSGERVFELGPLPIPPPSEAPAVSLFVERARAAQGDFALTDDNRDDVLAIVTELEGLPLAIELAAARVRVLPPRQILARLSRRFDLLRGRGRGRHATLRATLDWSWDLLEDWERDALAQCAVFAGPFTIEDAEGVLSLPEDAPWPMDAVAALVDKSLARRISDDDGTLRFALYVSVQAYAREKLAERGAHVVAEAERRHGAWYARLGAPGAVEVLRGPRAADAMGQMRRALDNLVSAAERAVARGDAEVAVPATVAAGLVLDWQGQPEVASGLIEGALVVELDDDEILRLLMVQVPNLPPGERRTAAWSRALALAQALGDPVRTAGVRLMFTPVAASDIGPWVAEIRGLLGEVEDPWKEVHLVLAEVRALRSSGDPGAEEASRRAVRLADRSGSRRLQVRASLDLALGLLQMGRAEESLGPAAQARAYAEELDHHREVTRAIGCLGLASVVLGRTEAGLAEFRELADRAARQGLPGLAMNASNNMGVLLLIQGRLPEALEVFEALASDPPDPSDPRCHHWRSNHALVLLELDRVDDALHASAGFLTSELSFPLTVLGSGLAAHALACGRAGRIDEAERHMGRAVEALRKVSALPALSFVLCHQAELAAIRGDRERAETLIAEGRALAMQVGSLETSYHPRAAAQAEAALDRVETPG